jgi:diguanylate cyclase (GGDEF)-like protein
VRAKDALDEALLQLRTVIEAAVRDEQLRDQLTGLPNDTSLAEWLEDSLGKRKTEPFWVAFFEVDKFKRVNDEFGYEMADGLLCAVARHLPKGADYFTEKAIAFRAHGDEFFLTCRMGTQPAAAVGVALDVLRQSIRTIRLPVEGRDRAMQCTMSVGWVTSDQGGAEVSPREIRVMLEKAMAEAKRQGRDRVVRFSDALARLVLVSLRENCPTCKAAFTVDYPEDSAVNDEMFCPNCGARIARQAVPPPHTIPVIEA